jgi:hypothetical protein
VKPLQGKKLAPEVIKRIQEAIKDKLSRRHVPAKILFCDGELLIYAASLVAECATDQHGYLPLSLL